jgi:hypothetical protein
MNESIGNDMDTGVWDATFFGEYFLREANVVVVCGDPWRLIGCYYELCYGRTLLLLLISYLYVWQRTVPSKLS